VPLFGSGSLVGGSIGLGQASGQTLEAVVDIVCSSQSIEEIAVVLVVLVDTAVEDVADIVVEVADIAVGIGIVDQVWMPEMPLPPAQRLLELWRDISQT
jgi:hypothetical protein